MWPRSLDKNFMERYSRTAINWQKGGQMAINYSALTTELERLIEMKKGQRERKIYSEYLESLHKIQRSIKMRSIFEHWFRK